jgi:hypothetical protein
MAQAVDFGSHVLYSFSQHPLDLMLIQLA